jgi:hypothetical protein
LHPHRTDVLAVLDGVLVEDADLFEAELAVQTHGGLDIEAATASPVNGRSSKTAFDAAT